MLGRDGRLLLTFPTPRAKPLLGFLAFRLGVVNGSEIRDHEVYHDRDRLEASPSREGFRVERCGTFLLGCNSLCVARRL